MAGRAAIRKPVKDKSIPGPVLGEYCKHEWMPVKSPKVQQCRLCGELRMKPGEK